MSIKSTGWQGSNSCFQIRCWQPNQVLEHPAWLAFQSGANLRPTDA
jgi:hypothetical protein